MRITEARRANVEAVLGVEREAFAAEDVPDLVAGLLEDPTAKPLLSLLAWEGDAPVGHIMFTAGHLEPATELEVTILAPLAVIPEWQDRGVGGRLIEEGMRRLSRAGTDLVFVLGHPGYYPRHGFSPALQFDLAAPYAVSPQEAWMVRALRAGILGSVSGTVRCANALDRPEHWRE